MTFRALPNRSDCGCFCHTTFDGLSCVHVVACCIPDVIQWEKDAEDKEEVMLENLASEDLPQELDPDQAESAICKWCDRAIFDGPNWHDAEGFENCRIRVNHFHEPKEE